MRLQNTWMGDSPRIEILQTVLDEIRKENLLDLARDSGDVLLSGLKELEVCACRMHRNGIFLSYSVHVVNV